MAYTIPIVPPTELRLGSSWFWDVTYPQFPASDSWELNLFFRGANDFDVVWLTGITASSGAAFEVRITPTLVTAGSLTTPGPYILYGTVTLAGEVHDVDDCHLLVLAAPSAVVNEKTFNRQMLEMFQGAAISLGEGGLKYAEVSINGRKSVFAVEEYEKKLAHYTLLVAIEENPTGKFVHETVFVRA